MNEKMDFNLDCKLEGCERESVDASGYCKKHIILRPYEQDKARLDWLEAQQGDNLGTMHLSQCGAGGMGRNWFKKQIRAAIDEAMKTSR